MNSSKESAEKFVETAKLIFSVIPFSSRRRDLEEE